MRVVIDANVMISGFLIENSISSKAILKVLHLHSPLASVPVLNELKAKLPSKKFDNYVDLSTRLAFVMKLEENAETIEVTHSVSICRDPKDNKYLELALSGIADCIITGDNDLLALNPFEGIPIITPKEFIERY